MLSSSSLVGGFVADEMDLRTRIDEMDRSISDHFVEMRDFVTFSITNAVTKLGTELRAEMKTGFHAVDKRFEAVDRRFETVDKRFDAIDRRFDAVDKRFEVIDRRFEAMDRRFDRIESKLDRALSGRPARRRRPKRG